MPSARAHTHAHTHTCCIQLRHAVHFARLCSSAEKLLLWPSVSSDFTHSMTKPKSRWGSEHTDCSQCEFSWRWHVMRWTHRGRVERRASRYRYPVKLHPAAPQAHVSGWHECCDVMAVKRIQRPRVDKASWSGIILHEGRIEAKGSSVAESMFL